MKITNIKVEGVINPVGVDEKKPVFSWNISGKQNDIFQEDYRIIVKIGNDFSGDIVWDSKQIKSSNTTGIEYSGKALFPDTIYSFKIYSTINGKSVESEISKFITGLLNTKISGSWLTTEKSGKTIPETCAFVRKTFNVSDMTYATLHICSYGWYEVFLNGIKYDDRVLSPTKSSFDSLMFYETYDITNLLESGTNTLSLILGDGYNNNANIFMGRYEGDKKFIACVNIHKSNGTIERIVTDNTWKFTLNTPWIKNNIYNGEIYDATREINDWQTYDFDDSKWSHMHISPIVEKTKLYCDIGPYMKIIKTIKPKKIYPTKDGRYIIDFGQNISGFVRIKLKGERGKTVRIKTAEEIYPQKFGYELKIITNRGAAATDTYIMKGDGIETYNPHFTYHGFRYAEICGLDKKPIGDEIVACVVHTDFKEYIDFKTDNQLINRIHQNAFWSVCSNSVSFPSDCVARDERTPCAMDLFCYLKSAMYMFSPSAYYQRYLKSNNINKLINSKINMTWNGCLIALPWYFYRYYGNKTLIKRYYNILKKLQITYLKQCGDGVPSATFGDWCSPNDYGNYLTSFSCEKETEYHMKYLTSYMMADMAKILNKQDDFLMFNSQAEKVRNKYIECFYDKEKHCFSNGKQSANLYALSNEFLDKNEQVLVSNNLIRLISENDNHLDLGIFGINYLVEELDKLGKIDTALECYMNPEYPSFAHQISKGATTLWEQWCVYGDMSSHNHAMFAGAVSGFYTNLAGVFPIENGFRVIGVKPTLTKYIKNLKFGFNTVNGVFKMEYKIVDEKFHLSIYIPPNSNAEITLPNGEKHLVGNGLFRFCCINKDLQL